MDGLDGISKLAKYVRCQIKGLNFNIFHELMIVRENVRPNFHYFFSSTRKNTNFDTHRESDDLMECHLYPLQVMQLTRKMCNKNTISHQDCDVLTASN